MKRVSLVCLLTVGLSLPLANPAEAIFGMSKCEKMRKELKYEENIGYESWKRFDETRDYLVKQGYVTNADYYSASGLIISLKDSDHIVYKLAVKNPKCFTVKENVDNRRALASTNSILSSMKTFQSNFLSGKMNQSYRNEPAFNFIKGYYKKFQFISTGEIFSN